MSSRVVAVRLRAEVADFKRQLKSAADEAAAVGTKTQQSQVKANTALGQMVQSATRHEQAWTQVGTSLLGIGTAAAAGVAVAVTKFADFDQAMSHVQAATHETAATMDLLRDASLKAGADTQYTATEAARGVEELAKAGVNAKDILGGGLTGALSLAAAGTIDVGDAAETAATAMTMFKLSGKDVPHIADLLAAGAGKAQGSVSDMGMALKQAGLVADATGLSIEETTGGLAAFASAGLVGSDAGTSFKSMLQRLTPQSQEAQAKMDELGISAYDAQGNFVGLSKFAGNLQGALKDLTPEQRNSALATIYGSDAVRAATVLYSQGATGVQGWIDKVNDAGYAADTAKIKTDNLRGDVERLGGSLDTAFIKTGSAANNVLRDMAQKLESVVNAYGEADPVVQTATLVIGTATAAVALLSGGFFLLAPRIVATRTAVSTLNTSMPKLSGFMGGLGQAAGIAGAAFGIIQLTDALTNLADGGGKSVPGVEAVTTAILKLDGAAVSAGFTTTDGIDSISEALDVLAGNGGITRKLDLWASKLDGAFGVTFISSVSDSKKALGTFDKALADLVAGGHADKAAAGLQLLYSKVDQSKYSMDDLKAMLPGYAEALAGAANTQDLTAGSAETLADKMSNLSPAVQAASDAVLKWEQAVSDADASFVNIQGAYDAVIQSNKDMATATADSTKSADDSWQTYYDGLTVTADQYIAQLQTQVDAQNNWETNMLAISDRVKTGMTGDMQTAAQGMITELLNLGPDGAAQVQLLKDMSEEQFTQVVTLWSQKGTDAVTEFTNKVESYRQPVIDITANTTSAYQKWQQLLADLGGTVTVPFKFGQSAAISTGGSSSTGGGAGKGWANGGYTGAGAKYQPAGIVHRGEYVVKAESVPKIGLARLDSLNARGYASGGLVGGGSVSAPSVSAGPAFTVESMTVVGFDPSDAVRQFGHEVAWTMVGMPR